MAGNEVISRHVHASGGLADCRGRLKGLVITHKTGSTGDIILYDNSSAAAGAVLVEVDETTAGTFTIDVPGDGIIFEDGVYASLPANTSLTVFVQLGGR